MKFNNDEKSLVEELYQQASAARLNAYAPYSRFLVGAALRCSSGRIYSGCNVENISYGGTICAERTAIGSAVTAGEREITEILIVTDTPEAVHPCGICRQSILEFGRQAVVYLTTVNGGPVDAEKKSMTEIMPFSKPFLVP